MDAAFSVVRGGKQWVVRASRLAPARAHARPRSDRSRSRCVEPLRALHAARRRQRLRPRRRPRRSTARTAAIEEPRFTHRVAGRARHGLDSPHAVRRLGRHAHGSAATTIADRRRDACSARATARGASAPSASPRAARPACCRSSSGCGRRSSFDDVCVHFDVQRGRRGPALARERQHRTGRRLRRRAPSST